MEKVTSEMIWILMITIGFIIIFLILLQVLGINNPDAFVKAFRTIMGEIVVFILYQLKILVR